MSKKMQSSRSEPAGIQYSGEPGSSKDCQDAVVRLIQHGDPLTSARILTNGNRHCLILTLGEVDLIAIKSGFTSGYGGTGPSTFSYVLQLLEAHEVEITEVDVDEDVLERLDNSSLTRFDIDTIQQAHPILPSRWPDYIYEKHWERKQGGKQWIEFPPVIPYAIIDRRIADLALSFWEAPDDRLLKGYRRLEDIIRKRTAIDDHGHKLFSRAFLPPDQKLAWPGSDKSEQIGKANLFVGAFMAFRNPRAHKELSDYSHKLLAEFLLLNHLYLLEGETKKARRRPRTSRKA